jgi:succinate dehydrogenase / fumarate reductase iron-sulfur subunit
MQTYRVHDVSPDMSFLEMLDLLNENLICDGQDPVAFDHDCREGVCGSCSMVIDGEAHGPLRRTTTCQLYMRHFQDGASIYIEPWRAAAFPVIKDLVTDRSAFDRIIQAGGYISNHSGPKPDPNAIPIHPDVAEQALDASVCIGCGACVAACPNASGMLFVSAKVAHLALLPQGQPERFERVQDMLDQMQQEGLGACGNYGECEAQCPKGISIANIGLLNRDYIRASLSQPIQRAGEMGTQ